MRPQERYFRSGLVGSASNKQHITGVVFWHTLRVEGFKRSWVGFEGTLIENHRCVVRITSCIPSFLRVTHITVKDKLFCLWPLHEVSVVFIGEAWQGGFCPDQGDCVAARLLTSKPKPQRRLYRLVSARTRSPVFRKILYERVLHKLPKALVVVVTTTTATTPIVELRWQNCRDTHCILMFDVYVNHEMLT